MCGLPRAVPGTSGPGFQFYKVPNTASLAKDVIRRWREDGTFMASSVLSFTPPWLKHCSIFGEREVLKYTFTNNIAPSSLDLPV